MNIRQTRQEDLAEVMAMYDYARRFMQEHGNGNQWINGYPSEELISNEIKASHSFVCENEQGELVGTFCYIEGIDPTYLKIYEGEWLNDEPYAVIHRMASNGKQKGISTECLKWAFAHCDNIRIDTHRDNIVMQNLLKKQEIASVLYIAAILSTICIYLLYIHMKSFYMMEVRFLCRKKDMLKSKIN